jgi:hypothetical protein
MADPRRNDKFMRKAQHSSREVRQEMLEEIRSSVTKPRQENPNRDRARGDWDRSGVHQDAGMSRADNETE